MSPASAGRFLTVGPPRKAKGSIFNSSGRPSECPLTPVWKQSGGLRRRIVRSSVRVSSGIRVISNSWNPETLAGLVHSGKEPVGRRGAQPRRTIRKQPWMQPGQEGPRPKATQGEKPGQGPQTPGPAQVRDCPGRFRFMLKNPQTHLWPKPQCWEPRHHDGQSPPHPAMSWAPA